MDPRLFGEVSITDLFDQFIEASTMKNVLSIHHRIMNYADLNPCEFNTFFPKLKRAVLTSKVRKNWKAKALFSKIDRKALHKCYSNTKTSTIPNGGLSENQNNPQESLNDSCSRANYSNNALKNYSCLIIGSGPAGLRTAIELQLLGASKVVVVEKRSRFSRNNVLHLWPFVIDDLKSLGAKKFYGKFCAGSIDHISIRQLQLILLKICLMLGCDFRDSCSFQYLCPASINLDKYFRQVNNNSDSLKEFGNCDVTESISTVCDLDVLETNPSDNFLKVSEGKDDCDDGENGLGSYIVSDSMKAHEGSLQITKSSEIVGSSDLSEEPMIFKEFDEAPSTSRKDINEERIFIAEEPGGYNHDMKHGARAHFQSEFPMQEKELHSIEWDFIVGADGRRNTLSKFFPRKEFRGRLAIAITANFINRQTPVEAAVPEISGLSFIYNQDMFNALAHDTDIHLENICYYKDDTHYFVMTAKKKSLLERGVLLNDYATTHDLLSDKNVDKQALLNYAKDAAYWTTGLEPLDFALNHYGQEDCAMFDFTSMYAASNACKALRTTKGGLTLMSLVGDSLLEPFWPTGSGCARGFLSSFDAAWMCRQWAVNNCAIIGHHDTTSSKSHRNKFESVKLPKATTYNRMALSVMAERESIYRILAQTTSENLHQNFSHWSLNPHSRYPNLNRHLVIPTQVEHLITDYEFKKPKDKIKLSPEKIRRGVSPNNLVNRRSPKKLKSANASPLMKQRNRIKYRQTFKSRSKHEINFDDTYLELEKSYNNLTVLGKCENNNYSNHGRPNCDIYNDHFVPSLSGTLPSSNNLLNLEARRARDIEECLNQRRQRSQLSAVRDQLINQFKKNISVDRNNSSGSKTSIGPSLTTELRKLREQQLSSKENKTKELNGPLTLLNSMRRCASFAERVKSFECKLGTNGQESPLPSTPKIPIDNVKNLPEFVTLQEIFVNNLTTTNEPVKKKMPIMKLSKDDWNVKCWENRLSVHRHKNSMKDMTGSTKSLSRAVSVDNYRTVRQVEVFRDRIKEMADKLQKARNDNGLSEKIITGPNHNRLKTTTARVEGKKQLDRGRGGWVSHVRKELIKGVESRRMQFDSQICSGPTLPKKPIKKLFEDDEEDDGKHYDHLCINRPTNKYLLKNGYTSHLTRTKYNSATSKVINCAPTKESKMAYMNALASRESSASSTLSDYSTATGGSSSGGDKNFRDQDDVKCFKCKELVNFDDSILVGSMNLHRTCLICSRCRITLRTDEMHDCIEQIKKDTSKYGSESNSFSFFCSLCQISKQYDLNYMEGDKSTCALGNPNEMDSATRRIRSREEFLNSKINYNELYKNILDNNQASSKISTGKMNSLVDGKSNKVVEHIDEQDMESQKSDKEPDQDRAIKISTSSPIDSTPTMNSNQNFNLLRQESMDSGLNKRSSYRIARSETVDGSEQVTLVLPIRESSDVLLDDDSSSSVSSPRIMIDEEEFHRILHLGNRTSEIHESKSKSESDDDSDGTVDDNNDQIGEEIKVEDSSDKSSSLNSQPASESNYEDFPTSEDFDGSTTDEDGDDDNIIDGNDKEDSNDQDAGENDNAFLEQHKTKEILEL